MPSRGLRGCRVGRLPGHGRRSAASARGDPAISTNGSREAMSTSSSPRATRGGGTSTGLADRTRVLVSKAATALTRAMFPIRLKDVSDPMTGFFLIDRRAVDAATLKPRGFKILLEILARKNLRVAEVPFDFADRHAGESKASVRQGLHFLTQLTALRFGKMSLFAVIGGLGAIANLAIVWALTQLGSTTSPRRSSPPRRRSSATSCSSSASSSRTCGRGIRRLDALREVVLVQQRRGAHPHPDRGAHGRAGTSPP